MRIGPLVLSTLAFACVTPFARGLSQTRPEIIRGRVTTDSGKVIANADVIATMAPNRETFRTTSDSSGQYEIEIANGTGDYLVYVGAPGRKPLRKRITRVGGDPVFVVDASLPADVTTVAAIRSTTQRTRPPRNDDAPGAVGALTTQFATVVGALSPDQMGDLAAMAATIPGVAVTPDGGISVLGVDPSANRTTLNGMTFDGASLPRDLPTRTRVYASAYDPAIGGFGGALVAVEISPGQTLTFGRGHLTIDAPQLQAADDASRQLGQRYTRVSGSIGRSGELQQDAWVYSMGLSGAQRVAPVPSIVSANAEVLQRLGASRDSANRFLSLLGQLGIPSAVSGIGHNSASTDITAAVRLDRAQSNSFGLSQDTRVRVALTGVGSVRRSDPLTSSALAPMTRDLRSTSGNAFVQGEVSQYLGSDASYLSETKSAVSYTVQQTTPFLAVPSGSVRVTSFLADGTQGISGFQFGGASSRNDTRTWRWEASNELSFSPISAVAHRLKLFSQAQLDGYSQSTESNALGNFAYNSLADLAANVPASYSRTLFSPLRTGGEASGAFSLTDFWTKSPELQFVFGPRIEWNAFTKSPRENAEVARLFGAHTSTTPSAVHMSPRFGFSWIYPGLRVAGRGGVSSSNLGMQFMPPRGVLRGGIGEFRAPLLASLVSDAIVSTGLDGTTTQRISCVGPAVPPAAWSALLTNPAASPSTCVNASGASAFSDAAPAVSLFDASYAPVRRWTGNLTWASAYRVFRYTIDASYSDTRDLPSTVDLNYSGASKFALSNEAARPVYVNASSIVPLSGLVSPLDSRVSTEFGRVASRRSDLRSTTKQITISGLPYLPERLASIMLGGSYTFTDSRTLARGFDGATFGDPSQREWSAGFAPRQQVRFQLGYYLRKFSSFFTTYWSFQSGYPYTPLVAGDINGDGLSNDRAFIFRPTSAPSASVASAMTTLLASTTSEARDCLERQLGGVASRNSCRRPWTATLNARIDWAKRFGDPYHYLNGSINFANPLSGVDQLLHGSNGLRGWGSPAAPDQTLYYVRGFDPTAQRFVYEVNPRFGNTRPSLAALYNPFRVTLDFSFSLTGNAAKQQVEVYLRPTRGAPGVRPPADTILRRLRSTGSSGITPYAWLIQNADSLLLTPNQLSAITEAQTRRQVSIDSMYKALSIELAAVPMSHDLDDVLKRVQDARQPIFEWPRAEGAYLAEVLSPIQIRLLPNGFVRSFSIAK